MEKLNYWTKVDFGQTTQIYSVRAASFAILVYAALLLHNTTRSNAPILDDAALLGKIGCSPAG